MVIKEILEKSYQNHISSGKFSISGINGCWRKKYRLLKELCLICGKSSTECKCDGGIKLKEEFDERTKRIFDRGNEIHRAMVRELLAKGPSAGWEVATSEANVPDTFPFLSGRTDCILSFSSTGELIPLDFKSVSSYIFKQIQAKDYSGIENYISQINLYVYLFKRKRGFLVFVDKNSQAIEELEVSLDIEKAEKQIKEIDEFFKNNINKNIEPDKCNISVSPFGCECCNISKMEFNKNGFS